MPSDCAQDKFVLDTLENLRDGFWVELGCRGPVVSSNTHILETLYGWKGLSIDISQSHIDEWQGVRNTDHLLCADALSLDYESLFEQHGVPEVVDYLSVDLEPPMITLEALYKIPFDKYKFRVITFEHDAYRDDRTKEPSRNFLLDLGYTLVNPEILNTYYSGVSNAEDWYTLDV